MIEMYFNKRTINSVWDGPLVETIKLKAQVHFVFDRADKITLQKLSRIADFMLSTNAPTRQRHPINELYEKLLKDILTDFKCNVH